MSGATAAAHPPQIFQERTQPKSREIIDHQAIGWLFLRLAHKRQQQNQRVPVTGLGVAGQITVRDQMLQQETADPRSNQGAVTVTHGAPPVEHSVRSEDWLHLTVLRSW